MEAGGGWCSTAIMVPSLNKAPILATGRLHGPLKFVAFAQDLLLFPCELMCGSVGASTRAACCGAAQVCLEVAADGCRIYNTCRLCYLCLFAMLSNNCNCQWLLRARFVPIRDDAEVFQLFTERFLLHWQRVSYSQRPASDLK